MSNLCQGRVIYVRIADQRGLNLKEHPVIVLTKNSDLASAEVLVGVVASHTAALENPQPDDYVAIPWYEGGRCASQFDRPTVAVCSWVVEVEKTEIIRFAGCVGGRYLLKITKRVLEVDKRQQGQSPTPSSPSPPS